MLNRRQSESIPSRALEAIVDGGQARVMRVIGDIERGRSVVRADGTEFAWPTHRSLGTHMALSGMPSIGKNTAPEQHVSRAGVLDLFHSGALTLATSMAKHNQVLEFCGKYGFTREQLQPTDEFLGYAE